MKLWVHIIEQLTVECGVWNTKNYAKILLEVDFRACHLNFNSTHKARGGAQVEKVYEKWSIRNTGDFFLLAPVISNPKYAPVVSICSVGIYSNFVRYVPNFVCTKLSYYTMERSGIVSIFVNLAYSH